MIKSESNRQFKRKELNWVQFDQDGYAIDWYFLVHAAFKDALDIYYVVRVNATKTADLRDKKSLEITGSSHAAYKNKLKISGYKLSDDEIHCEIMKYKIGYIVETGGMPALFSFRASDSMESRCGCWSVQIDQATPDQNGVVGNVGFTLYEKNHAPGIFNGVWKKNSWRSVSQSEFVSLLRHGKCQSLDLTNLGLIK